MENEMSADRPLCYFCDGHLVADGTGSLNCSDNACPGWQYATVWDCLADLTARLENAKEQLASVLVPLERRRAAGGSFSGGGLVARPGPWKPEGQDELARVVEANAGPGLWDAIRAAGYEIVELPEAIYGALGPETK
jgi:hypothetical protein